MSAQERVRQSFSESLLFKSESSKVDLVEKNLIRTQKEKHVLVITLNAPQSRNSLTLELREALGEAVEQAEKDRTVRCVLLLGEGPTFCSGGDLNHLKASSEPWQIHRRFRNLKDWLTPLITLEKPVVVGIGGHAVGGGVGLAISGDVLIASQSASFIAGFFRLGAVPDIATMYHLPRLIGMARAKRFLFETGQMSVEQALEYGLISKIVSNSQLIGACMEEADRLASGPAEVMGLAKALMARSFETSLSDMLAFEGFGQVLAMSNPEFHEGLSALLDRRKPNFIRAAVKPDDGQKSV